MVLVDGEAQVQQFQLAIVSIQQISPRSTVLASASHVLPQPIQRGTLLSISFRVIAIGSAYVALERIDPIDLVGLLQRDRDHGHERGHAATGVGELGEASARLPAQRRSERIAQGLTLTVEVS